MMRNRAASRREPVRGYTLIEMIITVAVICLLAAYGIPRYTRTVLENRENLARAKLSMIASANQMRMGDKGSFDTSSPFNSSSLLVTEKYITDQEWVSEAYNYYGANNATGSDCVVARARPKRAGLSGNSFCADRLGNIKVDTLSSCNQPNCVPAETASFSGLAAPTAPTLIQ